MFTRLMLACLLVTVAATGVASAAPTGPDFSDERAIDRYVSPEEMYGPKIDPDNPIKPPVYHEIFAIDKILDGPNPVEITVEAVVVR
jgi:hypothetical protein